MTEPLLKHFVYLSKQMTNLRNVLNHLEQHEIISKNESENILEAKTTLERNTGLLTLLQKKDWSANSRKILAILRKTLNDHCADVIEGKKVEPLRKKVLMLDGKWWPSEKDLPENFYLRKGKGTQLLIEEIHNLISSGSQKVAITGLGGVGKTAAALWYAKYYGEEYDHIIWFEFGYGIDALNPMLCFGLLSSALKLETVDYDPTLTAFKLFKLLTGLKCLFVFDNVIIKARIVEMISFCHENFHVIVTTREPQWSFPTIILEHFKIKESLKFFKNNLLIGTEFPDVKITELCGLLNNWPIAIQIANEAINNGNVTVDEYLEDVKQSDEIIHEKFRGVSIYESMETSMELIEKSGAVVWKLVVLFAFVKQEDVDVEYIQKMEQFETSEVESGLEYLRKNFILQKYKLEVQNIDRAMEMDAWSMPNLIRKCVRHRFKKYPRDSLKGQQRIIGMFWNQKRHYLTTFL